MNIDPRGIRVSRTSDSTAEPPARAVVSRVNAQLLANLHRQFTEHVSQSSVLIHGVDFSSAPSRAKPIMVASGLVNLDCGQVRVERLQPISTLAAYEQWLSTNIASITGFDMPFGLPREFVESQHWSTDWPACLASYAALSRDDLRVRFKAFCDQRPVGGKFAHRETDKPAGSSPSMKWVNPPVAWMLHAGVPPIVRAGLTLPGLQFGDPSRIALEAYPGLLARSVTKASYKSDSKAKQNNARQRERETLVRALQAGRTRPGMATSFGISLRESLVTDGSGDCLDAVLCLVQAAWGLQRAQRDFGLNPEFDSLEGWIVGAGLS